MWTSSVDKHTVEGERPVQLCNYTDAYKNDRVRPGPGLMRATASVDEIRRNHLEVGDSVFTKDSEDPSDIGISAYVDDTADDFVCGYHLAVARPAGGTHSRFLNWSLRSRPVLDHFGTHATGISRYGIGLADLRSAPIPEVEHEQQRRIADFLDERVSRIDRIIAARREQMHLLDLGRTSVADDLLAKVKERWARLGHFVRSIEQGWSPQCDSVRADPGEWGVLKVSAVQSGWFDATENKRLPDSESPLTEYEIQSGDLLVTRANTPRRVGFFAVVPSDVRSRLILCDKIMRLGVDPVVDPQFVALVGQSRRTRDRFTMAGTGTSGSMVNIRGSDVCDLLIPVMSLEEQSRLVAAWTGQTQSIQAQKQLLNESVSLLTEYRSSLITAAVTGELDVTTAGSNIPG